MDAKITKQRLGNFLSYDWLKILIAIALTVFALCVFFTTVSTRPRSDQVYELYATDSLYGGTDIQNFEDRALDEIFSYEILQVRYEVFGQFDMYGQTAYQARRAAGQGEAIFVSGQDYTVYEDGDPVEKNHLTDFVEGGISNLGEANEICHPYLDLPALFSDCESYLARAFGADWESAEAPEEQAVREIFLARNKNDKRFRTASKKKAGEVLEAARLVKLRDDFLTVRGALESGLISYTPYTSPAGNTYTVALNVGGLGRLCDLVYYVEEDADNPVRKSDGMHIVFFYNSHTDDLRFENICLLGWMIRTYA